MSDELQLRLIIFEQQSRIMELESDLRVALDDSNRSREIIYAMSEALKPNEGEHNIDCAKRVAKSAEELERDIKTLRRERDECQFALGYDEGTLLENIKKIKAWAQSNVKLAWEKNNNSIAYMEKLQQQLKEEKLLGNTALSDLLAFQKEHQQLELQVQVMRQALKQYNAIVAAILSMGGTDINAWWDKIITAQQDGAVALSIPPLPSQYVKREVADKMRKYLSHVEECRIHKEPDYDCDCGMQEALSLYEQQINGSNPPR